MGLVNRIRKELSDMGLGLALLFSMGVGAFLLGVIGFSYNFISWYLLYRHIYPAARTSGCDWHKY